MSEFNSLTNEERTALIKSVEPLCVKVAAGFKKQWCGILTGVRLEELTQAAMRGAFEASRRFREDGGAKYSSFAVWWMRRELQVELNFYWSGGATRIPPQELMEGKTRAKRGAHGHTRVIRNSEHREGFNPFLTVRSRPDGETTPESEDLWKRIEQCVDKREAMILHARFMKGTSLKELADSMGVCKERVRQLSQRGLGKLRMKMSPV
jgi:RNA polymerase sigma factor (sigma-70 family)